jgi:FtsP/CotA-like multicopper oxidase with cupredoxin domain
MKNTLPLVLAFLLPLPLLAQATVDLFAAPGTAQVAPGVAVSAWLFNGSLPGPTLRVVQGQTLRVRFHNNLPEPSAVHWHGQPVPLGMDGVPGISRPAVAPGQEFLYELTNLVPGTYWFHPHGHEGQLDVGLAGVLIVDPANPSADPPFDVEQVVVLDEWSNPLGGAFSGHLLNGRSSAGQTPIVVQPGQRLRLRFVNASAVTNYVVALDGHAMTVTHADGNRVQPVTVQAIPIGIGERYDAIVDCNNAGVWSLAAAAITNRNATVVRGVLQYAGQTQAPPAAAYVPPNLSGGSLLTYAQLAAYFPVTPITATPDRVYTATLAMSMGTGGMQHTINGQAWPNVTPFLAAAGDDVQLTFVNTGMMMMSEFHPMHVHGHFFRLMGTAGGTIAPPRKDTVLIWPSGQPGSSLQVQLAMDNPGRWLLHCHNMDHMASGMMTAIEYVGDADADGLPDAADQDPLAAAPVVTIPDQAASFAPGASGQIEVQWTPGALVGLFGGPELPSPVVLPPYGTLWLDPFAVAVLGAAVVPTNGFAAVPYALPPNPALSGARLGLQGLGTTPAPVGLVLSTFQAFTVR